MQPSTPHSLYRPAESRRSSSATGTHAPPRRPGDRPRRTVPGSARDRPLGRTAHNALFTPSMTYADPVGPAGVRFSDEVFAFLPSCGHTTYRTVAASTDRRTDRG